MSESKEDESSLLRDRASPDHDGTVGLYPVTEATIAGNLKEMFFEMTPANDIDLRFSTSAPSIRVDGMMVAGG